MPSRRERQRREEQDRRLRARGVPVMGRREALKVLGVGGASTLTIALLAEGCNPLSTGAPSVEATRRPTETSGPDNTPPPTGTADSEGRPNGNPGGQEATATPDLAYEKLTNGYTEAQIAQAETRFADRHAVASGIVNGLATVNKSGSAEWGLAPVLAFDSNSNVANAYWEGRLLQGTYVFEGGNEYGVGTVVVPSPVKGHEDESMWLSASGASARLGGAEVTRVGMDPVTGRAVAWNGNQEVGFVDTGTGQWTRMVAAATVEATATRESGVSPTPSATETPYVEVMAESVNLRSGPGTTCDVVGGVDQGDRLTLLGYSRTDSGVWYQVAVDGRTAWVFNGNLTSANRSLDVLVNVAATPCATATPEATATVTPVPTETPRPEAPPMKMGQTPTLDQISNCPAGEFPEASGLPQHAVDNGGALGLITEKPGGLVISVRQRLNNDVSSLNLSGLQWVRVRQIADRSRYPLWNDSWDQVAAPGSIEEIYQYLTPGTQVLVMDVAGDYGMIIYCDCVR